MPLCKKDEALKKNGKLNKGYYTRTIKKEGKKDRIMYFSPNTNKKEKKPTKDEIIEDLPDTVKLY